MSNPTGVTWVAADNIGWYPGRGTARAILVSTRRRNVLRQNQLVHDDHSVVAETVPQIYGPHAVRIRLNHLGHCYAPLVMVSMVMNHAHENSPQPRSHPPGGAVIIFILPC